VCLLVCHCECAHEYTRDESSTPTRGVQLFGDIPYGEWINADANFCTFTYALLTMFRCATG
jgi:hypothetical protein